MSRFFHAGWRPIILVLSALLFLAPRQEAQAQCSQSLYNFGPEKYCGPATQSCPSGDTCYYCSCGPCISTSGFVYFCAAQGWGCVFPCCNSCN